MFSLVGFVSSKRRLHRPPNSWAMPKFRQMDFAWPICKCPLGSGGKRVCTCLPIAWLSRSAETFALIKSMEECWSSDDIGNKLSEKLMPEFQGNHIFKNKIRFLWFLFIGTRNLRERRGRKASANTLSATCSGVFHTFRRPFPHATMSHANSQHG